MLYIVGFSGAGLDSVPSALTGLFPPLPPSESFLRPVFRLSVSIVTSFKAMEKELLTLSSSTFSSH